MTATPEPLIPKPHVACVVAMNLNGQIACSLRPLDKRDFPGHFALPGGKQDPGESLHQTAQREASEEGWDIAVHPEPFFIADVDGHKVHWFAGHNPRMLTTFKEKARGVEPVFKSVSDVVNSGFSNDLAIPVFLSQATW